MGMATSSQTKNYKPHHIHAYMSIKLFDTSAPLDSNDFVGIFGKEISKII